MLQSYTTLKLQGSSTICSAVVMKDIKDYEVMVAGKGIVAVRLQRILTKKKTHDWHHSCRQQDVSIGKQKLGDVTESSPNKGVNANFYCTKKGANRQEIYAGC